MARCREKMATGGGAADLPSAEELLTIIGRAAADIARLEEAAREQARRPLAAAWWGLLLCAGCSVRVERRSAWNARSRMPYAASVYNSLLYLAPLQPGGAEPALLSTQAELQELHRRYCSLMVTIEKQDLKREVKVETVSYSCGCNPLEESRW